MVGNQVTNSRWRLGGVTQNLNERRALDWQLVGMALLEFLYRLGIKIHSLRIDNFCQLLHKYFDIIFEDKNASSFSSTSVFFKLNKYTSGTC